MGASSFARGQAYRTKLFALAEKETKKEAFGALAMEVFRYQVAHNPTYRSYFKGLGARIEQVRHYQDIPFLPIGLYREQLIQTGTWEPEVCFQSSTTTAEQPSLHPIEDLCFYEEVAARIFEQVYGPLEGMLILGLLPDYLSRPRSSLIQMLSALMRRSGHPGSAFFMHQHDSLALRVRAAATEPGAKQLWGLPLALLDFIEKYPDLPLDSFQVIETGGTKGSTSLASLEELRERLGSSIPTVVHSEYGMTELLSQAYARDGKRLRPPAWMRVWARDLDDPLGLLPTEEIGALNIMDLAAAHSCAFVATDDLGKVFLDQSFEVLGRCKDATPRGCHAMYEQKESS